MKNLIIIALVLSILMACGSSGGGTTPPVIPPVTNTPAPDPVPSGSVGFSCISVDNDQVCSGIQDSPGIWNSGPISISGSPMPEDFLNIEVTNNSQQDASMFVYTLFTINGCGDNPYAFDIGTLNPGESAVMTQAVMNVQCGMLGYQEAVIGLYNASGFNPADYPNPWTFPRTDLITEATVQWDNRLPGDMP